MKVFLTAFISMTCTITYGQESFIRWNDRQQLQWQDFTGKVNDTSKFAAETFAAITYYYKTSNKKDFEFEVYANFDKNTSWRRKEMQCADLLKHEQVHFNIAALFAEKLKNDFTNYHYSANFSEEILDIFTKNKLEYQDTQSQYDEETNHSLNKRKQKEWEENIASELKKAILHLQLALR